MLNSDCNADCKTCILKQNIYNKECSKCILFKSNAHNNCYSGVISDDSYNQKVKHLLQLLNKKRLHLVITGGEPTINSIRFISTLNSIAEICDKQNTTICIETNGARLLQFKDMINNFINDGMNINILLNRYALNDELNNQEFLYKYDSISNKDIELFTKQLKAPINIRCIMLNNNIKSLQDVKDFYNYYKNLGINNIFFTTPMLDESLIENNSKMFEYIKKQNVSFIDDINYTTQFYINASMRCIIIDDILIQDNRCYKYNTLHHNNSQYSEFILYSNGRLGTTIIEDRC